MKLVKYLLYLIIILIGITFACLNSNDVSVNYYIQSSSLPLSLLVAFVFGIGGVVGILVSLKMVIKAKASSIGLRKKIKKIENEIARLKEIKTSTI